jgi:uncharacterized RDD family membrane protein YckC
LTVFFSTSQNHVAQICIAIGKSLTMPEFPVHPYSPAGLFSRLGALVSDALVVFGLLSLSTLFLFVPVLSSLNKKAMMPSEVGWLWSAIYFAVMIAIWFGFHGYFWTRTGQTIGMRAWRIRVVTEQEASINWPQALYRWLGAALPWLPCIIVLMLAEHFGSLPCRYFGEALAALGVAAWLIMYFDPQRRTWHDQISKTHVIKLPKL